MPRYAAVLTALLLTLTAPRAASELVVIANRDSGVEKLTRGEAVNIFMGRYKKLPSGIAALPVDEGHEKAAFYRTLLGKDLAEVQSYWARLVFSGQGSPPRQMESAAEVIETVIHNKGAIGYVDRKQLDRQVKVVLVLAP
jgi:ABC-type phosphate transport system substrate-binding protein